MAISGSSQVRDGYVEVGEGEAADFQRRSGARRGCHCRGGDVDRVTGRRIGVTFSIGARGAVVGGHHVQCQVRMDRCDGVDADTGQRSSITSRV
jgi:hypothetical protein